MYPFVAKNPLPGNQIKYIEDREGGNLKLDDMFGFIECDVKTNDGYLGLLPVHKDGSLIMPNGEFRDVWFSEQLKFVKDQGYQIKPIRGYLFNKVENVFDSYVDDIKKKSTTKGAIKNINKLLLNSPFGGLGMSIDKNISTFVDKDRLDYILSTRDNVIYHTITNNLFLVCHSNLVSEEKCLHSSLGYIKVLNSEGRSEEIINYVRDVSISTAASITSYAQIFITKAKLWVLKNGGKIYYSDTDSLVTSIPLPMEWVGGEMGKFKLEFRIKKAYFITTKTYYIETESGETIIKSKGAFSDSLNLKDFEDMYYNHKKHIFAVKSTSLKNYIFN